MNKTIVCVIVFLFLSVTLHAQGWQWAKTGRPGSGVYVEGWAVAADARGNSYGGGTNQTGSGITFSSAVTVSNPGGFMAQAIWAKFDPSGNPLWAGGTQKDDAVLTGVATDTSGNLIVFGYFFDSVQVGGTMLHATSSVLQQYFLAKFSPSGTLLWVVRDGSTAVLGLDATGAVTTDAAGNIYITSSFSRPTITVGPYTLTKVGTGTTADMYAAKYTPSGSVVWATSLGGTGNDYAYSIAVATTGYVYIAGNVQSPSITIGSSTYTCGSGFGYGVAVIAKLSPAGMPVWGQVAGGHPAWAVSNGLAADTSGNVYMTGDFADTSITFGSTVLTKPYLGSYDAAAYVVRYTPADTMDWAKVIGGPSGITGRSVTVSPCGWVWVSGSYEDTADIDGHMLPVDTGSADPAYLAGYEISGTAVEYTGLRSGGDDAIGIACDGYGNIFFCADYQVAGLVFGRDTVAYPGGEPFILAKYTPAGACCPVFSPPAVTITAIGGDTVCADSSITLTAAHSGSLVDYHWMINGTPVGTDTSAYTYIPVSGDSVYCIITGLTPCGAHDTGFSNVIHLFTSSSDASPGIYITPSVDTLCLGDSAVFSATISVGGSSPLLQWKMNGVNIGTGSTIIFLPHLGIDTVWCELTSNFPCLSSLTATSNVVAMLVRVCEGGVPLINANAIEIAPNPATKEFVIHSTAMLLSGSKAELVDVTGRIVSTYPLSGRTNTIPVSTLTPGIYLCRITSASGDVVTKRIVIER